MDWLNSNKVEKVFNWLNSERAAQIISICKSHGATCKRLAQQRGALGHCKVLATFNLHSWAASNEAYGKARRSLDEAGLINSLTFQDS
jgi:hypothetical protein